VAKAGCARVAFPIVKGNREGGLWYNGMLVSCPRLSCEGDSRPLKGCAAHLSLVKRKDEATRVYLERAMFYRRKMVDLCGSSAARVQYMPTRFGSEAVTNLQRLYVTAIPQRTQVSVRV
jgi:hypothetical protein